MGTGADTSIEEVVKKCLEVCGSNMQVPGMPEHSGLAFDIESLFPFNVAFSEGITKEEWVSSMLVQPDLFIRIRKQKEKVLALLAEHQIPYKFISDSCLSLPNGAKIDAILPPDTYAVQDASSQKTGGYFQPQSNGQWYDCCCGAGGKSLLLKDMAPTVQLTVSDRRESIIHNLKERFKLYGHTLPVSHVVDVADKNALEKVMKGKTFDNIICDAPCSGSGTWGRTPEQFHFFTPALIEKYTTLQKAIATNVASYLRPGGRLIYITCSVFRDENEDVAEDVIKRTGLQLQEHHLINGIGIKADSMFVAVFKKGGEN
jgi:16S rRNA (cytosine967-C5)-methyltransferase